MKNEFLKELRENWSVLPNLLTEARGILSPVPAILLLWGPRYRIVAMVVFVVIVATDKLDGYIAKNYNMQTKLGKILDPIVDKMLIIFTLIALSIDNPIFWWPTALIFVREVVVAYWTVRIRQRGLEVAVVQSGRVKMVVQSAAVAMMFLLPGDGYLTIATWAVIIMALALTIMSGIDYATMYAKVE
jgi:CDP-diacylglycerol--glycerol-3-phosphate 3-phosphatidyltransferase